MKVIRKKTLTERRMTGTNMSAFNEIEIIKRLHNPNIIHIHEIIDDKKDDHMYIVMQFVEKCDMDAYIEKQNGQLIPLETIR